MSPNGRVLVTHVLPDGALAPLLDAGHDVVQRDGDTSPVDLTRELHEGAFDAVVCPLTVHVDTAAIAAGAPRLRVVANVAVGYDNVDVAAAAAAGVAVCNTPGVLDETTADLAFALILAASRGLPGAEGDLRAGRWDGFRFLGHLGRDVHGATLGLVGYGRIGRAVARRAAGFGMQVLHHTRHDTAEPGWCAELDSMLPRCDVVSLHVPLTDDTRLLLDARRLALLRPTAVLVNTARGAVVDEEALAIALEEGRLFAAGLDVYTDEPRVHPRLLHAPRTVLLPHVGSATVATRAAMARLAAAGAAAVLAGDRPPNLVPGTGPWANDVQPP